MTSIRIGCSRSDARFLSASPSASLRTPANTRNPSESKRSAHTAPIPVDAPVITMLFPFPDSLDWAADVGATAVIEPGGAKKDAEVIARAEELDLAMIFTGTRHFNH